MKVELAEARSEIMAPLSAASMESYSRAYPYLVKLHMLQVCTYIYPFQFWLDKGSTLCADAFGVGCVVSECYRRRCESEEHLRSFAYLQPARVLTLKCFVSPLIAILCVQ